MQQNTCMQNIFNVQRIKISSYEENNRTKYSRALSLYFAGGGKCQLLPGHLCRSCYTSLTNESKSYQNAMWTRSAPGSLALGNIMWTWWNSFLQSSFIHPDRLLFQSMPCHMLSSQLINLFPIVSVIPFSLPFLAMLAWS